MNKLFSAVLALVLLFSLAGCSRFGIHDNPPMSVTVAENDNH